MLTDDVVSCNTQPSMLRNGCPRRGWGNWGWLGPRSPGTAATRRGRATRVEGACAFGTVGSRLVAPPSAIFAAIAAVCSEPAATTAPWRRNRRRNWRGDRRGNWKGHGIGNRRTRASGRRRTTRIEGARALGTIGSRLVAPASAIFAAIAAVCSEPAATAASWRGNWRGASAHTAARRTSFQHVARVRLALSAGGPISAELVIIKARSWRRLRRTRRRLGSGRADTAALTTSFQHVAGVRLALSTGGPISTKLIIIGARSWRWLRTWRRLRHWRPPARR